MEADVPQQHEVMRGQAVDESFADNRGRLRERELELEKREDQVANPLEPEDEGKQDPSMPSK